MWLRQEALCLRWEEVVREVTRGLSAVLLESVLAETHQRWYGKLAPRAED